MAEAGQRLIPGGNTHNITTEVTPTSSTVNNIGTTTIGTESSIVLILSDYHKDLSLISAGNHKYVHV